MSYRQFETDLASVIPETQIVRMNPSESLMLVNGAIAPARPLDWVIPVGAQNLDYEFRPNEIPLATAEIARKFEPLTEDQLDRVLGFCKTGLIAKYKVLAADFHPYFAAKVYWRLSVFDHQGFKTQFVYCIHGRHIEIADRDVAMPLGWATEVSVNKLYSALERGESLTSMYIRINDIEFEPFISRRIDVVELTEDPLVRCLFEGVFGAYQKAQLARLRARDCTPT